MPTATPIERIRWIYEQWDFMGDLARSYTAANKNRKDHRAIQDAEDIRGNAYLVATEAIEAGRGPADQAIARPYICCCLKNAMFRLVRETRRYKPSELDKMPVITAVTEQEVLQEFETHERRTDLARQIATEYPEHVKNLRVGESGLDVGARQKRFRSRSFLAAQFGAALVATAAVIVLSIKARPAAVDLEPAGTLTAQRSGALREAALRHCAASEWASCQAGLDDARLVDPAGDEAPAVRAARQKARDGIEADAPTKLSPDVARRVADLRAHAIDECKAGNWYGCLFELDAARRDDPQGDLSPIITLARAQATEGLRTGGTPLDDAKQPPRGAPR